MARTHVRRWIFALTGLFLAAPAPAGADVVGGHPATRPYKFMVSVQYTANDGHLCGGTLLQKQWVLTAAHCVSDQTPDALQVMLGSHRLSAPGTVIGVAEIVTHEEYSDTSDYDVALLRMIRKAPFKPTRVPTPAERDIWEPRTPATALGWGVDDFLIGQSPDELHEVEVPIVSDAECARSYTVPIAGTFNPQTMVCAGELLGGSDTCQGDSGGPLLVRDGTGRFVVMGVTSWGMGCGYPTFYGVYSRVGDTTLYDWIDAHLP